MPKSSDPRHEKRIEIMKGLFSASFSDAQAKSSNVKPILEQQTQLDTLIQDCAPEWPISQINKIDLAILRQALYELNLGKTPYKVIIDEAVELAKEYGSENSAKFVNGVLGSAVKRLKI
jgi:transcription antitermination protein NusB